MPKKTGKLSRIMGQSAAEMASLSGSEARDQYNYLRKVIREREKGFQKAGKQGRFDRTYGIMGPPSLRGLSDAQVKKQLGRMVKQLSGAESTITGVQKAIQETNMRRQRALEKKLGRDPEKNPLTPEEAREFGRFLGDMQDRYGDNWKHVSDDYIELLDTPGFGEALLADRREVVINLSLQASAEKLGLKTDQFMKNYDYWAAHEKQLLLEGERIKTKKDRKLTPSDYIKKLRLPSIRDWRAGMDDN